jgi:histone acetyltransferase (RNA polymerase elongator complex component)
MIVPVFLPHLGCTDRCIYCDQGCITDVHSHDLPSLIKKTLEKAGGKYEVGLFGGNIFNIEPSVLKTLFQFFDSFSDNILNFRISTKPVPLKSETIRILKEKRVTVVELGMPVFNDTILKKLNRGHTVEDFYRAFHLLKNEGFHVALQVMAGLPDETMIDIKETAEHIIRLSPHYIRIYPLAVLKNTPLHRMYENGLFAPIQFEEAIERAIYIYLHALKQGIKTVKMGLTDNEIIKDSVVAGQFHPAFGYMVKSQAFYLAIKAKIDIASIKGDITVRLNSADIPHLVGHKRKNIERFKEQGICVTWEKQDIEQGNFTLCSSQTIINGNIFDALITLSR